MAGINKGTDKNEEAETCTDNFTTKVSAPGVLDNNVDVTINMDALCLSASKVQFLKANFVDALGLPGTAADYRLMGVEEENAREIDENTTIHDIYQYIHTGCFIMNKMPKHG